MAEHQHSYQPVYDYDENGNQILMGYRCECGAYQPA